MIPLGLELVTLLLSARRRVGASVDLDAAGRLRARKEEEVAETGGKDGGRRGGGVRQDGGENGGGVRQESCCQLAQGLGCCQR